MSYWYVFITVRFYDFTRPNILIADADLARKVLQTEFDNYRNRAKAVGESDLIGYVPVVTGDCDTDCACLVRVCCS